MERITPPPNYYGAPYPPASGSNTSYPQGNSPYGQNPGNGTPPIFPQGGSFPVQGSEQDVQINSNENKVDSVFASVRDEVHAINQFYAAFREYLSKNIGNEVKVYCSFTDSTKWHDVIFEGTLVAAANDHLIVKAKNANYYYMIVGVYINFIELYEKS